MWISEVSDLLDKSVNKSTALIRNTPIRQLLVSVAIATGTNSTVVSVQNKRWSSYQRHMARIYYSTETLHTQSDIFFNHRLPGVCLCYRPPEWLKQGCVSSVTADSAYTASAGLNGRITCRFDHKATVWLPLTSLCVRAHAHVLEI